MKYDVVLIGGGIMSATLGTLLKELNPNIKLAIIESQPGIASESSNNWNNAGTGHAGLCELNFTPEVDGKIDISKALHVTESFEMSKQFWAYLAEKHPEFDVTDFIHKVAHMSFVDHDIDFLKKRFDTMKGHHFYNSMEYSESYDKLMEWMPLVMTGRNPAQHVAATHADGGTDMSYGNLTHHLINYLTTLPYVNVLLNTKVNDIQRFECYNHQVNAKTKDSWVITADNGWVIHSDFVFIGAGGAAISLLEKAGIPEAYGYAGFPVSGQFLVCKNKEVIKKHSAKVYGKADIGAPPMSVPHLDTRVIDGEKQLLFGPFAGFSTKFLKHGSYLDFFKSIRFSNLKPMLAAGYHNIPLTKYLVQQVTLSFDDKIKELQRYYPEAKAEDWEIHTAGQRVQIIKGDKEQGGIIEFGTEVISSVDGSLAALLGASPGASTSVHIMVQLIEKCFPQMKSEAWIAAMKQMIPSYQQSLIDNKELYLNIKQHTDSVLFGQPQK